MMVVSSRWVRVRFALLTVLGVLVSLAAATSAQTFDRRDIELYSSGQFDWFFFYDASIWSIAERSVEDGSEWLRLSDGEVFVDYWAFLDPGTSAEACVSMVFDGLASDPSIAKIEALSAAGGEAVITTPPAYPADDDAVPSFAWSELVITVETQRERYKLATREECRQISPDGSLLYRSTNVPAALYNEWGGFYGGGRPELASSYPVNFMFDWGAPIAINDGPGSPRGTLAPYVFCNEVFKVVARNTGRRENLVIDPDRFVAVYPENGVVAELAGQTHGPSWHEWIYPPLPPTSPLVLRPGEIGLFQLEISPIWYELYFETEAGSRVFLTTNNGGCGAGGAAPVVIDLE